MRVLRARGLLQGRASHKGFPMALNDNTSTDQGATGTNIYVQALLNQGWRWDLAAAVNAGRTIDYVLDGTWTQAEQDAVRAVFDAWQSVANIKIQAEPTNDFSKAEIVIHHTTRAGIGGFLATRARPSTLKPGPLEIWGRSEALPKSKMSILPMWGAFILTLHSTPRPLPAR